MLKIIIFASYFSYVILTVAADAMIGPGKWNMLNIEKKDADVNTFEFDICQRKYNRSHDMFLGTITFNEEMNERYTATIVVCKHVDGGCKQYQVITDNFINLIRVYATPNFFDILKLAGLEDPEFPVPEGKYEFKDYFWNWDGMPEEGPWGRYTAECCVLDVNNVKCGCLLVDLAFEKVDDDDDDDEDKK